MLLGITHMTVERSSRLRARVVSLTIMSKLAVNDFHRYIIFYIMRSQMPTITYQKLSDTYPRVVEPFSERIQQWQHTSIIEDCYITK